LCKITQADDFRENAGHFKDVPVRADTRPGPAPRDLARGMKAKAAVREAQA
jgi:hypothetical protein